MALTQPHGSEQQSPALLTQKQVAEYLQVTERTVRRLTAVGRLSPVRFSATLVRFKKEDIEALIAAAQTN